MARFTSTAALALCLAACSQGQSEADVPGLDEAAVAEQSRPVAEAFASSLQAELVAALGEGGPMQAVEVCHEAAPRIAAEQSLASGARVSRISDRNRNPEGGVSEDVAPHYAALAMQPLTDGQPSKRIWQSGAGDAARINFLSAIPMRDQPCAACHGSNIDPALQARISELYPADLATGFAVGELRGAVLVSWPAAEFAR